MSGIWTIVVALLFSSVAAAEDLDRDYVDDSQAARAGAGATSTLPVSGTFLYDRSHGGFMNLADFRSYLVSQHWTFLEHTAGTITPELLNGVDVLFFGPGPYISFSDGEIATIHAFLTEGGGLWMVSDYLYYEDVLNQIAGPLGVTFHDDSIFGWLSVTDILLHAVTDGVSGYMSYASCCLEAATPALLLARTAGSTFHCPQHPGALAVCESGLGRAVFQGDSTPLHSSYFPENLSSQNLRLIENILVWLVETTGPVANDGTSWGEVKASYR